MFHDDGDVDSNRNQLLLVKQSMQRRV